MTLKEWCDDLLAANGHDTLVTLHKREGCRYAIHLADPTPELTREQLAVRIANAEAAAPDVPRISPSHHLNVTEYRQRFRKESVDNHRDDYVIGAGWVGTAKALHAWQFGPSEPERLIAMHQRLRNSM